MSRQLKINIPDEEVVIEFNKFFSKIAKEKNKFKGKTVQKALKLILTIHGHDKYRYDPEVEELWNIYSNTNEGPHTKNEEIGMIKLKNTKERAYAALYLLMVETDEKFTIEEFAKIVNKELGYSNRAVKSYLDLLARTDVISRINAETYRFKENKIWGKYLTKEITKTIRNEILMIAVKESEKKG